MPTTVVSGEADDAIFLASRYGLTPDPWQVGVLEDWLGRQADGRWAAARCGLAVPRQNGKNAVIEVRELFGMVGLGERFLHTAHEVKTARKAFIRIKSFFENDAFPELAGLVKEIRHTNGQEAVVLRNGGSVEFIARSRSSGRGFTVDVLVCDEAQELTAEELEALGPTVSAAPLADPQMIFTGTPPKPDRAQGEVFRSLREAGQDGTDERLAWSDFGVADGALPDVDDRELWFSTNPGLEPGRIGLDEIEGERKLYSPEGFAKERLGWWERSTRCGGALDVDLWASLDAEPPELVAPSFGVDLDEAGTAYFAVAWRRPDGLVHVQLAGRSTASKLQERADYLTLEHGGQVFAGGPALSLLDNAETVSSAEFAAACRRFADMLPELRHSDEPELNASVGQARWRTASADGTQAWQLKDTPGIGPLAAVTRALHGLVGVSVYDSRGLTVLGG